MVKRDDAYPKIAPVKVLGNAEVMSKVDYYMRFTKKRPMAEYSIQGNLRLIKGLMNKYSFTEPTLQVAETIKVDLRMRKKSEDTVRIYMIALEHMSVALNGKKLGIEIPKGGGKKEKYLTVTEFGELMGTTNLADKTMFAVMFYTAARRKEMVNFSLRDVDLSKRVIWFRDNTLCPGVKYGGTKNHLEQPVPIHKELKPILEAWLEFRNSKGAGPTDPLFPNQDGKRYSLDGFGRLITTLTKKYLGKSVSAHAFRHGSASMYANDPRMPFAMVQTVMRHGDPRTTRGYVHHTTDDILRYMDKVSVVM